jgi:hypothetical protein
MKRIYRLLVTLGAVAALTVLAGCGPYSTNSSTSTTTPPTAVARTSPPVRMKPIPTPPPRSLRTGPVTLHASASAYRPGDTIVLILDNQSEQTIRFPDHLTECTVVLLQHQVGGPSFSNPLIRMPPQPVVHVQHQVGGTWTPVAPCRLEIVTRLHSLNPGQDLVVKLIAPFGHWLPGTYHGVLAYFASGSSRTIFSGDFQVV